MEKLNNQVVVPEDINKWWEAAFFGTLDPEVTKASGADLLRHYVRSGALDRNKAIEIAYKYDY